MLKVLPTHRYSNSMDIETPSTLLFYLFLQFLQISALNVSEPCHVKSLAYTQIFKQYGH